MKKQLAIGAALAVALSMPLVACGGSSTSTSSTTSSTTSSSTSSSSSSFDANSYYVGQWRGAVAITGTSVYGTTGGSEQMLDVIFAEDGTVSIEPLEAHADLLTDKGTWEGTEDEVTLHMTKGDIVLKANGKNALEGTASDFDIADFETINFDFYG
ncbi:hypothetical protein [Paratractidigestivibacter sp.]|uniref:hypothetical protein n=1 Tax=Paratractidigestivibacter sp. TaxID=2847316 RepID=UPI002ABE86E5|nr:hypothetical protein [Paratractidigestivibacter sp.]